MPGAGAQAGKSLARDTQASTQRGAPERRHHGRGRPNRLTSQLPCRVRAPPRPAAVPAPIVSPPLPAQIVTQPLTERPRVPVITVGLRPHPTSPDAGTPGQGPVGRLLATMYALPEGGAVFEFRIEGGALDQLVIPAPRRPAAAEALWEHTCFEAFLGRPGESAYREYNFSPSGQWAVYGFRAPRERDEAYRPATPPEIHCTQDDGTLLLEAHVPAALLPDTGDGSDLQVGLAAVIERRDGPLEYWALRHTADQPDFHARDTFVLSLTVGADKAD